MLWARRLWVVLAVLSISSSFSFSSSKPRRRLGRATTKTSASVEDLVATCVEAPPPNGRSIDEFLDLLDPVAVDDGLKRVVLSLFSACSQIAVEVSQASCDSTSCYYPTPEGEEVAIDLVAEQTLMAALRASGCVEVAATSEQPIEEPLGGKGYSVAAAPLSGDSIIDSNFAVGTSVGIWPGGTALADRYKGGVTGRDLCGSLMAVYSSRTTISLALDGVRDVHEFRLVPESSGSGGSGGGLAWSHSTTFSRIDADARLVAPRNARAASAHPGYRRLLGEWLERGAALRYSGGFVPDTNQIVAKGTGCWACTPKLVSALFCALPAAFIIEKAGGASSTGDGRSVLDHRVFTPSEKLQLALGSANDVKLFDEYVGPIVDEKEEGWENGS